MSHKKADRKEKIPEDKHVPLSVAVELALQKNEIESLPIDDFITNFIY